MFTEIQKAELAKPLNKSNVATRSQSGRNFSYIESWWAISEANRIFGFDGWTRETVEIRCISEREREVGRDKAQGWSVTYIGKVRITVDGVVREGCGAGHGIDRDLGQAHESAIKEMESDSAKRALMTFGNQFGLALYDKEQENVIDDTKPAPAKNELDRHTELETLKADLLEACEGGMDTLKAAWGRLSREEQSRLAWFKDKTLKPKAEEADANAPA
jgi:DNA recombination protein Rad52